VVLVSVADDGQSLKLDSTPLARPVLPQPAT